MKKLLLLMVALLGLGVSGVWATVSFKADTPYLMIQKESGKYVNIQYLNYDAALRSSWSLIYFSASEGGYIVSSGTNKLSAEGYYCYARDSKSTVWTISEVDGVVNGYKLYQNTSGNTGYFGSDEYAEGKPCFCDKAVEHASTTFIIIEANVYVKLLELRTIPALYSTSDIDLATTMIKGSVMTSSDQEDILETIYSSAEGKKFYAVSNSSGDATRYMNVGESIATGNNMSLTTDAIMTVEYASEGKYYLKGNNGKYICAPSSTANAAPGTTDDKASAGQYYIGNKDKTTNNYVFFTTSYSTTGTDRKALHWINNTNYLTGWSYDVPASQWTISYVSDSEFTSLSSATSETLTYTLTDANGAIYSGTVTGTLGVNPTFTGCYGYSLSNSVWNISTKTFTADVTFPIKISSNSKTNYTYIGSYQSKNFYWYAASPSATVVNVHYQNAPTNKSGEIEKYEWAIIPSCTNGAFTFTIKNASTGKYITSTSTEKKHDTKIEDSPVVSFSNTGTAFTYASNKQWCLPTTWNNNGTPTPLYLSLNSSGESIGLQYLGTWESHNGTKVSYFDPDDFTSLIADLTTARNTASSYTVGTRIGEFTETSSGTMATALSNANGIINGTAYGTAATITGYKTALETAVSGLTLNMPSSGPIFMRIRSSQGDKGYMTAANAGGRATFTSATDASTIYLWGADNKLVAYSNGFAYKDMYVPQANSANGVEYNVVAAVSGNFGQYSITSTYGSPASTVYLYSTGSGNADRNTASDNASWKQRNSFTLEAVTSLPITFKGEYASFYSPVDLTIPEGVKAYTGGITHDNWITLNEIEGTTLPHETGVILKYEGYDSEATDAANTKNFTILDTETEGSSTLTGKIATSTVDANSTLVLGKNGGDWGIFTYTGTVLNGFKAYMNMPAIGIKGFTFGFDDVDKVVSILNGEKGDGEVYDLCGRRVVKPTHGLYIVNGKKAIVK